MAEDDLGSLTKTYLNRSHGPRDDDQHADGGG